MPVKQKIKTATQFVLVFGSSLGGFMLFFSGIWLSVGLPYEPWGGWICIILSALSVCGTFRWIWRN